jgi:hypothetical protein
MKSDKLLIIDNKAGAERESSENVIAQLDESDRSLINHFRDITGFWEEDGDDVKINVDISCYTYIFIHDSYDDPIIQGGLKELLIKRMSLTSTVVLFSGTKRESPTPQQLCHEDICWYELRRSQYFMNLPRFMESRSILGTYQIEYLYDSSKDPKTDKGQMLADEISDLLEISPQKAAGSAAFIELIKLFGGQYDEKVYERFANMSEDSFLSTIDRLIHRK